MSVALLEGLEVGSALPSLTVRFTRERLVRYAGASTDFNPIHFSDHFAARMGLPGVIAHGMLTMGTALRVVTDWLGDQGTVRSYFVRFTRPIVVPDDDAGAEVTFSASVAAIAGPSVTLAIEAVFDDQKVLGAARAEVDFGA
jgi:acyl dehydratase